MIDIILNAVQQYACIIISMEGCAYVATTVYILRSGQARVVGLFVSAQKVNLVKRMWEKIATLFFWNVFMERNSRYSLKDQKYGEE